MSSLIFSPQGNPASRFAKLAALRRRASSVLLPSLAVALLAGCGTGAPKPVVGLVVETDVNGKAIPVITSLAAGTSVYLMVAVTDDAGLGADWLVTCSSALPPGTLPAGTVDTSCGSFSPAHTLSGPVPKFALTGAGYVAQYTAPSTKPKAGTVIITANATALPTRATSITLTIN